MYFYLLYHKSKEQEEFLSNFRWLNSYSQVFCCIAVFKFSVLKHLKNQGALGTTLKSRKFILGFIILLFIFKFQLAINTKYKYPNS